VSFLDAIVTRRLVKASWVKAKASLLFVHAAFLSRKGPRLVGNAALGSRKATWGLRKGRWLKPHVAFIHLHDAFVEIQVASPSSSVGFREPGASFPATAPPS
jgi:hypothetical protein